MNIATLTVCRLFCAILFVMPTAVFALASGPGSLDLTFNGTGYKIDTYGGQQGFDGGYKTIVQPDGKIMVGVAGYSLGRYNPDGSPDPSFGTGGKVITPFGPTFYQAAGDMALQPDGKIVAVGFRVITVPEDRRILVVRYNSDGTLDTTFGTNGSVVTYVDPTWMSCQASQVAIQPDGKIVIAGDKFSPVNISPVALIARYNTDGTLDASFDGDGMAAANVLTLTSGGGLAIQPDGKIVIAGESLTGNSSTATFILARFNTTGSLDGSFDGDGIVTTQMGPARSVATVVQMMPDGRIVAGGHTYDGSDIDIAFARYNTNGSLDASFSGDGKVFTHITSNYDYLNDIAIQTDGKVIAIGFDSVGPGDIRLLRYNTDGSLDSSYGSGGQALIDLGANERVYSIALDAAGRAVVAGATIAPYRTLIARVTAEQAPLVDVGGRLTDANGRGLSGVQVVLNRSDGTWQYTLTNGFGYYAFHYISSNEVYLVTISSKRYVFEPDSRSVILTSTTYDVDFIGSPRSETRSPVGGEKAIAKPALQPAPKRPAVKRPR